MGAADTIDHATKLLSQLVSIDSVNLDMPGATTGEKPYSDFVAGMGRDMGLEVSQSEALPGRPNVLLELKQTRARHTFLFDVHLDTVPLGGERAGTDPIVENGLLYGRGACDTKGSMAAALIALERLAANPPADNYNVALLGTVDEEYLKRGVDFAVDSGLTADVAIVGEPTELQAVTAHKGVVRWEVVTHGRTAHTSRPDRGINAVYAMTHVIDALRQRFETGGMVDPHPLCGESTLTVATVHGGVQVNIVPDECRIEIDRRTLPNEVGADFLEAVQLELDGLREREPWIDVESLEPFLMEDGLDTDPNAALVRHLQAACEKHGLPSVLGGVPYGTDGATLAPAGIQTVVLGPGSIEQAHSPDEWVELEQVEKCAMLYEEIVRTLAESAD